MYAFWQLKLEKDMLSFVETDNKILNAMRKKTAETDKKTALYSCIVCAFI